MITKEATIQIMKLLGQYLIDHAEELMPIEYSDLYGDEIVIRLRRIKGVGDATKGHDTTRSTDVQH